MKNPATTPRKRHCSHGKEDKETQKSQSLNAITEGQVFRHEIQERTAKPHRTVNRNSMRSVIHLRYEIDNAKYMA